jgi:hypothetical protein
MGSILAGSGVLTDRHMKFIGTLALMVVCGVIAFLAAVSFLMNLGLKLHGNYEYYGSFPSVLFVYASGGLGFVSPALLVWWLGQKQLEVRPS